MNLFTGFIQYLSSIVTFTEYYSIIKIQFIVNVGQFRVSSPQDC